MTEEETKAPTLDVIICLVHGGMEIVLQLGSDDPEPDWSQPVVKATSYFTKGPITIIPTNYLLFERISESRYQINLANVRAEKAMQSGKVLVPTMIPPRKLN